jgi:hypothetical protein
MIEEYIPFIIRVGEESNDSYSGTAEFRGAVRTSTMPTDLPQLTAKEIEQALRWLERGFIDHGYAHDLGERLFATLFSGTIEELFHEASI